MLKTIKSKTICNIIAGLFLLGAASTAFADINFLKPPATDLSLAYLLEFFGKWNSGVFAEKNVIAVMFKYFNIAMLTLGTIIIIYNVVVSIINTAHQGKFLGKKFDTVWGPIRVVLGFVLIIPTGSGYSIIQIFIMWMVTMGIGAADHLWSQAIDHVFKYGTPIHSNDSKISESGLIDKNALILQGLYCMQKRGDTSPPSHNGTKCTDTDVGTSCSATWTFTKDCGSVSLNFSSSSLSLVNKELVKNTHTIIANQLDADIKFLNLFAKKLNDAEELKKIKAEFEAHGINELASITRPFAMDFASELQNVKGKDAKPLTKDDYWTQQKRNGWLTAGIAQFRIARTTIASSMPPNFNELFATTSPANEEEIKDVKKFIGDLKNDATAMSNPDFLGQENAKNYGDSNWFGAIINNAVYGIAAAIKGIGFGLLSSSTDPIISLQFIGEILLLIAHLLYGFFAQATTITAGVVGVSIWGFNVSPLAHAVTLFIAGPILLISGALFVEGVMLAIILPLTPFILFMSAVIFWFIGVLETMLAGPLTALMFLFLEDSGNDILRGRAAPGINMMINMFLRPMLIIFGLFAGMKLVTIIVTLFLKFYSVAVLYILLPSGPNFAIIQAVMTGVGGLGAVIGIIAPSIFSVGALSIGIAPLAMFVTKIIMLFAVLVIAVTLIVSKIYTLCIIKMPNAVVDKFFQGGGTVGAEEGLMGELTSKAQQSATTLKDTSGAMGKGFESRPESESKGVGVTNTGGGSTSASSNSNTQVVSQNTSNTIPPTPAGKGTAGKQGNKSNEI